MDKQVRLLVKIIIVDRDGLILTLLRGKTAPDRPLTWDLPGGVVEFGEDPNLAIIRETYEEAGLSITDPKILNIQSSNDDKYVVRFTYVYLTDAKNVKISYEHDEFKWVTRDEFQKLNAPPYFKESVQQLPA